MNGSYPFKSTPFEASTASTSPAMGFSRMHGVFGVKAQKRGPCKGAAPDRGEPLNASDARGISPYEFRVARGEAMVSGDLSNVYLVLSSHRKNEEN